MEKQITVPDSDKIAGTLRKDIFIINKNMEDEYFRIFDGFGIHENLLDGLISDFVKEIHLFAHTNKDTQNQTTKLYATTPQAWKENGNVYKNPKWPYDRQIVLSLRHFEKR